MYAFAYRPLKTESYAYATMKPVMAMAKMAEIIKIVFVAQTFILAKKVHTEIHRLGLGLITATETFTEMAVAI